MNSLQKLMNEIRENPTGWKSIVQALVMGFVFTLLVMALWRLLF